MSGRGGLSTVKFRVVYDDGSYAFLDSWPVMTYAEAQDVRRIEARKGVHVTVWADVV